MSKQNRLYTDLAAGLSEGEAWTRGEKDLRATERPTTTQPSVPIATSSFLNNLYKPLIISYDQEADTLRICFSSADVEESYETEPDVLREYDVQGGLVRLEVQNFAARVGLPLFVAEDADPPAVLSAEHEANGSGLSTEPEIPLTKRGTVVGRIFQPGSSTTTSGTYSLVGPRAGKRTQTSNSSSKRKGAQPRKDQATSP